MSEEILIQHALKLLAECEYERHEATAGLFSEKLEISSQEVVKLLSNLRKTGLVEEAKSAQATEINLSDEGREYALHVLKAHRLYETYLAKKTGHPESVWHKLADEQEHSLSRADVRKLSEELGHPRFDPHGDPIPTSAGEMPAKRGATLIDHPEGRAVRVVHIEDEPEQLYARISAAGITTDSMLRIDYKDEVSMSLFVEGQTFSFPIEVAGQITVVQLTMDEHFDETIERLSTLKVGEQAEIVGMSSLCRGLERNRLLDLGVVPGTVTTAELVNPSGSPVGYRIRGACIALRREQADRIRIRKLIRNEDEQ